MAPPRTVLLTPTTRLSITDLAQCTYRPGQCVALVAEASALAEAPQLELLLRTTAYTTAKTVELVGDFWRKLGFLPQFELENPLPATAFALQN
jgi:3-hydroxyacyl-CoA dehydrogenase